MMSRLSIYPSSSRIVLGTLLLLIACLFTAHAFINPDNIQFPLEAATTGSDPELQFDLQSSILPPIFGLLPGIGDDKDRFFKDVVVSRGESSVDFYLHVNPLLSKKITSISGSALAFDLPNYRLTTSGTQPTCKFYNHKNSLLGTTTATSTTSGNILRPRCPFPNGFKWSENSSGIRVNIERITAVSRKSSSAQCQSSSLLAADLFAGVFADGFFGSFLAAIGASLRIGESTYCCPNFQVSYLEGKKIIYAAEVDRCTIHDDGDDSVVPGTIGFRNLNIAANPRIEQTEITLTASFKTDYKLNAIGRSTPKPVVPGYLWVNLPGYRQISSHKLPKCTIRANGDVVTYIPTHTAPAVVVRPLQGGHHGSTSEGIAVLCAIGRDIAAGSSVQVTIEDIMSPRSQFFSAACWSSSLVTTSSSCCNISVEYRRGNSPMNEVVYTSDTAKSCPLFAPKKGYFTYPTGERLDLDPHLGEVTFSPTEVSQNQAVDNAQFQFTPQVEVPTSTKMTAHFPGYRLRNENQKYIFLGISGVDNYYQVPATTSVDQFGVLIFAFVLPRKLAAGVGVIIRAPSVLASSSLPTADQCLVYGGSTSFDGVCCSEFRIVLYIANVLFIAHARSCSVLPPASVVDCSGDNWSYTKCCLRRSLRTSSSAVLDRCLAYECVSDSTVAFNPNICCQREIYRSNDYCCTGAFFCVNECCGQNTFYFEPVNCCLEENVQELLEAGTDIQPTCDCYDALEEGNYDVFDPVPPGEDATCCEVQFVDQSDYCECRESFELVEGTDGTQYYQVRNGVTNISPICCVFEPFERSTFCVCLESYNNPPFDTEACCIFEEFIDSPQCVGEGGGCTPPCGGCGCGCDGDGDADVSCCVLNRQDVEISNINSTDTNIAVINAGRLGRPPRRHGDHDHGHDGDHGDHDHGHGHGDGDHGGHHGHGGSGIRLIIDGVLGFRPW